jgi:hypothetical protein
MEWQSIPTLFSLINFCTMLGPGCDIDNCNPGTNQQNTGVKRKLKPFGQPKFGWPNGFGESFALNVPPKNERGRSSRCKFCIVMVARRGRVCISSGFWLIILL